MGGGVWLFDAGVLRHRADRLRRLVRRRRSLDRTPRRGWERVRTGDDAVSGRTTRMGRSTTSPTIDRWQATPAASLPTSTPRRPTPGRQLRLPAADQPPTGATELLTGEPVSQWLGDRLGGTARQRQVPASQRRPTNDASNSTVAAENLFSIYVERRRQPRDGVLAAHGGLHHPRQAGTQRFYLAQIDAEALVRRASCCSSTPGDLPGERRNPRTLSPNKACATTPRSITAPMRMGSPSDSGSGATGRTRSRRTNPGAAARSTTRSSSSPPLASCQLRLRRPPPEWREDRGRLVEDRVPGGRR